MKSYEVTKLEVSRRQLECAVKLFFNDQDSVSVHTLTEAANNVLRDLIKFKKKEKEIESIIMGKLPKFIKEEYKKEFIRKFRDPQNFFKHANKDPLARLEFRPEVNDLHLFDGVLMYEGLTGDLGDLMKTFKIWYIISHKDHFSDLKVGSKSLDEVASSAKDVGLLGDKRLFMKEVINALHEAV